MLMSTYNNRMHFMIATVLVCGRMFNGAPEELTGRTEILIEGSRIEGIGRSEWAVRSEGNSIFPITQ